MASLGAGNPEIDASGRGPGASGFVAKLLGLGGRLWRGLRRLLSGAWKRIQWPHRLRSNAWKRVHSTIAVTRCEIESRKENPALKDSASSIVALIEKADTSLKTGDIDGAWKHLQAAERLKLMAINLDELRPIIISMRYEAGKLKDWRKDACLNLLKAETDNQYVAPLAVVHAAQIRDEHYNNQAYKGRIRRSSSLWLAMAMIIGLTALITLARWGVLADILGDSADLRSGSPPVLLAMCTMGLLGAAFFSAVSGLSRRDEESRIPEIILSGQVTLLRLFVGPVSAIFVYFVLESGLAHQIAKLEQIDGFTLLTIGFMAGFSERFVVRFVQGFVGDKSAA